MTALAVCGGEPPGTPIPMMADTDRDALGGASPGADLALALKANGIDDVAAIRRAVAEFLARRSVPSTVIDDLELVTSELVTNAIVHRSSDDPVAVHVGLSETIEIEVCNHGSVASVPPVDAWRVPSPHEMSGRGLGIVRRLCDEAAIRQEGDWLVVRCRRHRPDGRSTS